MPESEIQSVCRAGAEMPHQASVYEKIVSDVLAGRAPVYKDYAAEWRRRGHHREEFAVFAEYAGYAAKLVCAPDFEIGAAVRAARTAQISRHPIPEFLFTPAEKKTILRAEEKGRIKAGQVIAFSGCRRKVFGCDYSGLPDDTESYTHRSGRTGRAGKTGTSIAIINLREKGKMREIERIIGKKFIAGEMPTGKQICEKQLLKVIDDLEKVKVNEEDINDFMPEIYRKLEWLSKEDLIKRMVSHEFNRFVDYYRNREEIEVPTDSRSERAGKSREGKSSRQAEPGYTRLFINLGKMDNFFPHELITLLNNNTRGRVELGRIDLMKNFSFFEVEEKQAQNVVKALNRTNWNGRKVTVEVAGEEASTEHKGRGKRNEGNDQGGRGRSSAPSADRKERGKGSKDSKQADSRKGKKPSREERGYSAARGPKGKDEWKQFFKDAEPDFSEEGWARRKPKKS